MADASFGSPEAAALAQWRQTPTAAARVERVTVRGRRAEVVVVLEPEYRDWIYCELGTAGWRATSSGNGPTVDWDDPGLGPSWADPEAG